MTRRPSASSRIVSILWTNPIACTSWQGAIDGDRHQRARLVADYIAGMTDRYALLEHKRLFDPTVKS